MFRLRKERLGQKIIFLIGNLCLVAGVTCLFFGISPSGVNPKAPEGAWTFALPLFGAALVLFVSGRFVKR